MKDLVKRIETDTGHYYIDPRTGKQIPGVTSVLKVLPKDQLDTWKLKKAVALALKGEKAWKDMPDDVDAVSWLIEAGEREALVAAKKGTNAHEFAEKYMLGLDPDIELLSKPEQYHARCFLQFVRDYEPSPVLVEKVVTHIDPKLNVPIYCGTIDLVALLTDRFTWMLDYKASASQPRPSHALQASAYFHSTHWIGEDGTLHPMPPMDKAAVILLNGGTVDRGYRWHRLDVSPVVFSVFKSLLRIYNFSKIEDRVLLGEL